MWLLSAGPSIRLKWGSLEVSFSFWTTTRTRATRHEHPYRLSTTNGSADVLMIGIAHKHESAALGKPMVAAAATRTAGLRAPMSGALALRVGWPLSDACSPHTYGPAVYCSSPCRCATATRVHTARWPTCVRERRYPCHCRRRTMRLLCEEKVVWSMV